jgi:Fe-S-cluster containining protein
MPAVDTLLPIFAPKPHRDTVAADQVLCQFCTAKCCRYFALPLDTPTTREEFEYIRWFLLHDHATVFTEDGEWYVCVHTVCKHLGEDHRCGIYETRPQICREYTTKDCEYEDDWVNRSRSTWMLCWGRGASRWERGDGRRTAASRSVGPAPIRSPSSDDVW